MAGWWDISRRWRIGDERELRAGVADDRSSRFCLRAGKLGGLFADESTAGEDLCCETGGPAFVEEIDEGTFESGCS